MEEYLNKGKEILKLLIRNGFEGYFIGDAVRCSIMNLPFTEIEITTSATPDALKGIFSFTKVDSLTENVIKVTYYGYDFYISTFRLDKHKDYKFPSKIHYSKNLRDDLACRDYTINAIAMSPSGKIIDQYNGYSDIRKGIIRPIGKPKVMFLEDPIQMLRAIRLVSEINFKLTKSVERGIKKRRKFLLNANPYDLAWELNKLLKGKYYSKALTLLIELKLYKYIPSLKQLFALQNKYYNRFKKLGSEEFIIAGFVLNGNVDEKYVPLVEGKKNYMQIYNLVLANPKSKYTLLELYENGLDVCLSANLINWALKRAKKKTRKITQEYKSLVVHNDNELEYKYSDLVKLTNRESEDIDSIYKQLVYKVLNRELENDYDMIKAFVIRKLKELKVNVNSNKEDQYYEDANFDNEEAKINELNNQYNELVNAKNEEEVTASLKKHGEIIKDYTQHRLDILEKRINEQERLLKQKDRQLAKLEYESRQKQINKDIESLVTKNIEMLKDMNYLNNPQTDKIELSKRLHRVYIDFISDIDKKYGLDEVDNEKN